MVFHYLCVPTTLTKPKCLTHRKYGLCFDCFEGLEAVVEAVGGVIDGYDGDANVRQLEIPRPLRVPYNHHLRDKGKLTPEPYIDFILQIHLGFYLTA